MSIDRKSEKGFTIIELLIATTVFGVMMLLAATGMIEIGRAYYKGLTSSKTQEIARSLERDITDSVKNGNDTVLREDVEPVAASTNFSMKAECVGATRYSYALNAREASVNSAPVSGPKTILHALWVDSLPSSSSPCIPVDLRTPNPSNDTPSSWGVEVSTDPALTNQYRDLLANNMRLSDFYIRPNASGSGVEISIRVLYGDEEVIDKSSGDSTKYTCLNNRLGGQFCAFSSNQAFVESR